MNFMLRHLLLCCIVGLSACTQLTVPEQSELMHERQQAATKVKPAVENAAGSDNQEQPAHQAAVNLWQRVMSGYGLLPENYYENENISDAIDFYVNYRDRLERMTENARPYLHYVVSELERRNMPMELALLPIVESGYKPHAYSPKHAAGMWQFIPSTGEHYGLKQNWWYDGRRDVIASTNAALDYLQKLYDEMDGDWLKAIAAYNCGEGRLRRAVDKNIAQGQPTDFWSLDLPSETRRYIPLLMAVSAIIAKPGVYGINLPEIADQPYLAKVETGGQIELDLAARLADIPLSELKLLNPGFKRSATDPDGPHSLLVPIDKAELFKHKLVQVPPERRAPSLRQEPQVYAVRKGDTLGRIAQKHGVSVAALGKLNGISTRSRLSVGQKLRVPTGEGKDSAPLQVAAAKSAKPAKPSQTAAKSNPPKNPKTGSKPTTTAKQDAHQRHRIRKGETLWDIARKYQVSINQLVQINGISKRAVLRVGSDLLVPKTRGG